jgi:ABC-type glycerol-3-phosphate transport system permease component
LRISLARSGIAVRMGEKKVKLTLGWMMLYTFMIALVLFTAIPLIYVVSTAFKPLDELFIWPPRFLVRRPTMQNFTNLIISLGSSTVPFVRFVFNSVFVTAVSVLLTVMVSSLGAYGIVKHKPPGSKTLFNIIIAALMFSPHVTRIPTYMVMNSLGLVNTYGSLILTYIAVAYNFFLMKQFTEQFPNDLLEAARIDGANELRVFFSIVMPSLTPAWSTLVVFSFVRIWNDYFTPLIFISSQAKKTMPLALQTIAGGPATMSIGRAGAVAAATFLMIVPTIIIFTTAQKKVMETMTHSGIKG